MGVHLRVNGAFLFDILPLYSLWVDFKTINHGVKADLICWHVSCLRGWQYFLSGVRVS